MELSIRGQSANGVLQLQFCMLKSARQIKGGSDYHTIT